jgi:hypothetical protein
VLGHQEIQHLRRQEAAVEPQDAQMGHPLPEGLQRRSHQALPRRAAPAQLVPDDHPGGEGHRPLVAVPPLVVGIVAGGRPLSLAPLGRFDRQVEVGDHRAPVESGLLVEVGPVDAVHLLDVPGGDLAQ